LARPRGASFSFGRDRTFRARPGTNGVLPRRSWRCLPIDCAAGGRAFLSTELGPAPQGLLSLGRAFVDGVAPTPAVGGTIVGATLACHEQLNTTIPCGARISMSAIGNRAWGSALGWSAKVGTMLTGKAEQLLAGKGKQRLSITSFERENMDSGLERASESPRPDARLRTAVL